MISTFCGGQEAFQLKVWMSFGVQIWTPIDIFGRDSRMAAQMETL